MKNKGIPARTPTAMDFYESSHGISVFHFDFLFFHSLFSHHFLTLAFSFLGPAVSGKWCGKGIEKRKRISEVNNFLSHGIIFISLRGIIPVIEVGPPSMILF